MASDRDISGVSKRYGTQAHGVLAVADVTLQVREGEFVAIIGPSGCDKSALFNIVGGMQAP